MIRKKRYEIHAAAAWYRPTVTHPRILHKYLGHESRLGKKSKNSLHSNHDTTITQTSHNMSGVPDTARDNLKGQPAPIQAVQRRKNKVWAVAFFNDCRRVVTGSHDKTLRILDVRQTGEMVGEPFKGHTDRVRSVAISPDDSRIVSGGDDTTVIIWDAESKQMLLDPLVKHTEKVNSVCFSPDGWRVASGSHDSTVVVWDTETGAVLATLDHRKTVRVWSVSFSPDGLKLASGSSDHTIRVWRTVNAECLLKINAGQWSVRSVVWSPDGSQLVSGSSDNTAKFWDSSNGEKIGQPCVGHTRWITCLAISSDNSFIATASDDSTVRLWCTKTHKQIGHSLKHAKKVHSVAISPDAKLLVSGADDGNLQLWSVRDILEHGKVEGSTTEYEEVHGEQLRSSETQSSCDSENEHTGYDGNYKEPSVDQDGASDSDAYDASGSDDQDSLFDIFAIKKTVRNSGDLHIIEDLLTHEIDFDEDDNRRDTYANRSIVRARKSEWDDALQDAVRSIAIQPSLLGYISKGIALCGSKQLWDAMEAFDSAFVFSNSDPNIINLLLLIKAIALFYAGRYDEAVRRVQDLTTTSQHSDPIPCSVVNSYLRVQLAVIAFQDGRYSEAADQLDRSVPSITDLFSSRALFEPRLKIFTVLFGWDFDTSWQTVNQIRCEAYLCADRVIEAVESHQYMMSMIDEDVKDSDLEWSTAFKNDCTARCIAKGDEAIAAKNYETAIELYSAGIELDSSCESLFVRRSKANLERNLFVVALHDANRVIKLNPSSYVGYELKNAALLGAVRCNEAEEAFEIMFSKLGDTPDRQIRQPQPCSSISNIDYLRQVIHTRLESTPPRPLIPDPPPLSIFVDASTSFGIGFLADSRWLAWELLDGWRANGRDIGWAEMVAIDLGLRALVRSGLRDVRVQLHSDHQGGVQALKAGRSRNVVQNDILQRLSSFALEHGIRIFVKWVRSCDNLADGISRGVFPPSRFRFSSPPPLPDYLKPFVRLV